MTSKFTRERLEELAAGQSGFNLRIATHEESQELARMVLAAIESEPVAYSLIFRNMDGALNNYINTNTTFATREKAEAYGKGGKYEMQSDGRLKLVPNTALDPVVVPLYRHAQPAPEYPETLPCPVLLEPGLRFGKGIKTSTMLAALSRRAVHESDMAALSPEERAEFQAGIEDVKALIAQPAPVAQCPYPCGWDTLNKLAIQDAAFVALSLVAGEPATESIRSAVISNNDRLLKVISFCRDAMPLAGNSPAQSDCCPAQNHVSPEQNGDTPAQSHGWIPVSERMPEPGILVLVYTPPQPDDYPGDVRIGFDFIDPDGDDPTYWFNHGENYEHFYCVACDGMTGPSEKAPYTHWIPLPAAPQEVKSE